MAERYYTLTFEKDPELGLVFSYREEIGGVVSTEPTDDIGRNLIEDWTVESLRPGLENVFSFGKNSVSVEVCMDC